MNTKVGIGSLRAVTPKSEKHPSYKGSITIGDQKYWLSGWKRRGEDGPWLSLSVETTDDATPAAPQRTYAQRRDDVGF